MNSLKYINIQWTNNINSRICFIKILIKITRHYIQDPPQVCGININQLMKLIN